MGARSQCRGQVTIIKISDKTSKDAFAVRNVADAKAAGLLVGGYHFLRNTASGADQAQAFLNTVSFGSGDLIPSLDIELIPATPAARAAYVQKAKAGGWADSWFAEAGTEFGAPFPAPPPQEARHSPEISIVRVAAQRAA